MAASPPPINQNKTKIYETMCMHYPITTTKTEADHLLQLLIKLRNLCFQHAHKLGHIPFPFLRYVQLVQLLIPSNSSFSRQRRGLLQQQTVKKMFDMFAGLNPIGAHLLLGNSLDGIINVRHLPRVAHVLLVACRGVSALVSENHAISIPSLTSSQRLCKEQPQRMYYKVFNT